MSDSQGDSHRTSNLIKRGMPACGSTLGLVDLLCLLWSIWPMIFFAPSWKPSHHPRRMLPKLWRTKYPAGQTRRMFCNRRRRETLAVECGCAEASGRRLAAGLLGWTMVGSREAGGVCLLHWRITETLRATFPFSGSAPQLTATH